MVTIETLSKKQGKSKTGKNTKAHTIHWEPAGRRGQCQKNESLLSCAQRLNVGISNICGGMGTCHTCKVQVLSGTVSAPTSEELEAFSPQELQNGWRLACQTYPLSSCELRVPPESLTTAQRTQIEGLETTIQPEPPVQAYHLQLTAPSLSDTQADADRLLEALNQQHQLECRRVDINVLRTLSPSLRSWNWECRASVRCDEVVALGPWPSSHLGLAVDLGTTKVAGYLVDLGDGRTLAAKGVVNPQIRYGEDIISRIAGVIDSPEESLKLQKLAVEALNKLVIDLCVEVDANREDIVEAVVVGNTAMHHLLLGLPVRQLAFSPFTPAASRALDVKARDLGLHIAAGAYVHLLPNIAGFVGADHVAMLLSTEAWRSEEPIVAMDIGTNTEVSLIKGGNIAAVSCASGPAFEGGHIRNGVRATSGAIERVRIVNDSVQYQTVDGTPPIGICGSGIVDAVAQLYQIGIVSKEGRLKDNHPRVHTANGQREFVLVSKEKRGGYPAIVITQHDIREVQLAKAAIRAGIQVLLETCGCSDEEVRQVIIAGAFGSYIDVSSATDIGMLPPLPLGRFRQVGNAAGMGAKLALVSVTRRAEAQTIASRVHYIELATTPHFMLTFSRAGYLGRYRITRGERGY